MATATAGFVAFGTAGFSGGSFGSLDGGRSAGLGFSAPRGFAFGVGVAVVVDVVGFPDSLSNEVTSVPSFFFSSSAFNLDLRSRALFGGRFPVCFTLLTCCSDFAELDTSSNTSVDIPVALVFVDGCSARRRCAAMGRFFFGIGVGCGFFAADTVEELFISLSLFLSPLMGSSSSSIRDCMMSDFAFDSSECNASLACSTVNLFSFTRLRMSRRSLRFNCNVFRRSRKIFLSKSPAVFSLFPSSPSSNLSTSSMAASGSSFPSCTFFTSASRSLSFMVMSTPSSTFDIRLKKRPHFFFFFSLLITEI
eukprot:m.136162 g.136162  ORF g.136162 m.136162 type:complete len:307 (-) comp13132_c1_seq1:1504-2424(-)